MTLEIEGMMCEHCERAVKKALESVPGVASATASYTAGKAVVTLSGEPDVEAMIAAGSEEDYEVRGVSYDA